MAFEQYSTSKQQACYKAPLLYTRPTLTPECTLDKYTTYFRKRWEALAIDPCKKKEKPSDWCHYYHSESKNGPSHHPRIHVKEGRPGSEICVPPEPLRYRKGYENPYFSHNNVDDCCRPSAGAECPCNGVIQKKKKPCCKIECKERRPPLEPLDDRTVYKSDFYSKPTGTPPGRFRPKPWNRSTWPMEGATTYRLEYPHKKHVPNGPVPAATTKHGLWSMEQFDSQESFPDETEQSSEFFEKDYSKRYPIRYNTNLQVGEGPFAKKTETSSEYKPKWVDYPRIPEWIKQEPIWVPPTPELDSCTTYKQFYQEYPIPNYPCQKIESPKAIPFSTLNNVWYTCCDPKIDQRTPVEIRDSDPWPDVRRCPIRYQDNLQTDPCAPFRDETTHKADYYPRPVCGKVENLSPAKGYVPPIQPFRDDTITKLSYRAYTRDEYKEAKKPMRKSRVWWGPFQCPPKEDKCLPRFPAPYGHPLKSFSNPPCPCGPFDDRTTYLNDFKFRSEEMVRQLEEEMCEQPNLTKGVSLYRDEYTDKWEDSVKSEKVLPPEGKGYRAIQPTHFRDLDTLYRMKHVDFWKLFDRPKLELYRGKRNDPLAVKRRKEGMEKCISEAEDEYKIEMMPEGTTVEDVLRSCSQE